MSLYDPTMWETLIALAALGVSCFSLWRTRSPQPHWEFLTLREEDDNDSESYNIETAEYEITGKLVVAVVRQSGPGAAEAVRTSVQFPDGEWSRTSAADSASINRGAEIGIVLGSHPLPPGDHRVRIEYRSLPNTRRDKRPWVHTLTAAELLRRVRDTQ